jgi:uncharacterized membrane protein YfcA
VPLPRVVGAGGVFNIAVALPSALAFVALGWGAAAVPGPALGFVALWPLLLLTVPALAVAPWAARLSARLPVALLRRLFALVLLAIAARLVLRLLG